LEHGVVGNRYPLRAFNQNRLVVGEVEQVVVDDNIGEFGGRIPVVLEIDAHHPQAIALGKEVVGDMDIAAVFRLAVEDPEVDVVAMVARATVIVRTDSAEIVALDGDIMNVGTRDMRQTQILDGVVENIQTFRGNRDDPLVEVGDIVAFEDDVARVLNGHAAADRVAGDAVDAILLGVFAFDMGVADRDIGRPRNHERAFMGIGVYGRLEVDINA